MEAEILNYFGSTAGIAALTVIIAGYLNKWLNINNSTWKQVISWVVSISLVAIAGTAQIGMFETFTWSKDWYIFIIEGILAGLASNGFYDIEIIKSFLRVIKILPAKYN